MSIGARVPEVQMDSSLLLAAYSSVYDAAAWRKVAGVEPTGKRLTPPTGFEARPHHRMRMPSEFADDGCRIGKLSPPRANCCRHAAPAHCVCAEYSQRGRRTQKSQSHPCAPL